MPPGYREDAIETTTPTLDRTEADTTKEGNLMRYLEFRLTAGRAADTSTSATRAHPCQRGDIPMHVLPTGIDDHRLPKEARRIVQQLPPQSHAHVLGTAADVPTAVLALCGAKVGTTQLRRGIAVIEISGAFEVEPID